MSEIETNIYRIVNLRELASKYRSYKVVGLHIDADSSDKDQEGYHQNCQRLTRALSYKLRSPAVVVDRKGEAILIVSQDAPAPPKEMGVVQGNVMFEPLAENLHLDYTMRDPENDAIAIRFLSFLVQGPLHNRLGLWQPSAGQPFFERTPNKQSEHLNRYQGYSVRPVLLASGDIGLCVDVHSKLIYRHSLAPFLDRQGFQPLRGTHVIYHFGHRWYETVLAEFNGLNISLYKFPMNGRSVTLYDHIMSECIKPLPREIAELPKNSSTVMYTDNRNDKRGAAAALCYRVAGNNDPKAQREFPSLSIPPQVRARLIQEFVEKHLQRLTFGDAELRLETTPLSTTPKLFPVPDLQFGCGVVLSTRGTAGAVQVSLDELGRKRMSLLRDKGVGFYEASPLDNFYFFMPQSVHETYGTVFFQSLCTTVDELFPQARSFEPRLLVYPDREMNFQRCSESLLGKAGECERGGYAVAMIPEFQRRRPRAEDTSAAHIIQQLRERFDVFASVIHTTVGNQSYVGRMDAVGSTVYVPDTKSEGRLNGYLRNVAINKIFLLNQKWPFVLATPLHADAVIGIDVKGNMAGFVGANKRGDFIVPVHRKSQQSEKLMTKQCRDYLLEIIGKLAEQSDSPIKHIVVHRDGRLYDTEINGIRKALDQLKEESLVAPDAEITLLEIPKTAPAPLRLFDTSIEASGRRFIDNPQVGNYFILSDKEGFVCTTGRAFPHKGTTKPLHVIKRSGPLSLDQCLQDVFSLSCLAWTRPEDCARDPITIKLNDRWLGEDGTQMEEEDEASEVEEAQAK